jgi:hypothetical protein
MSTRRFLVLGAVPVLALASALSAPHAVAQQPVSAASAGVDYTSGASWLCRPGREDACAVDQSATVILPGGSMSLEVWQPHADPPVDCFYVYPTVSQEQAPNSSINAGPGERGVVVSQLARFASQCRVYAPLYRQITLLALRAATAGQPMAPDREMAYADVRDAWNDYLARDNDGRGVVLIGHSQGSGMLRRLIQEEIEGKPIESRIVSAMLIGTNVLVPEGRDVGGDFRSMPLCRSASQTGCIVSYVTFRADVPPPPDSRFGRTSEPGMMVACTNPAALSGGPAGLDGYLSAGRAGLPPWPGDRHPLRARPRPADRRVRPRRTRLVPEGHRQSGSERSANRPHRRRRDGGRRGERDLGPPPGRRPRGHG